MKLESLNQQTNFKVVISSVDNTFTVIYDNIKNEEEFSSFRHFLRAFFKYFKNLIDNTDSISERASICDSFLKELQSYKSFRNKIKHKNEEEFLKEIDFYINEIIFFKIQFTQQTKDLLIEKNYTLKQQVLILHYLGCLTVIKNLGISDNKVGDIISALLGKDKTNTIRALRFMGRVVEKSDVETITKTNLEAVKKIFIENNVSEIVNKIQQDINSLKKG